MSNVIFIQENSIDESELQELVSQAQQIYSQHFPPTTRFERAIFFSWSCAINDCTFCYMSTQPKEVNNKNGKVARRSTASILAEALLTKHLGWELGFFSGGINAFSPDEFEELLQKLHTVWGERFWLNIGPTPRKHLERYQPYIKGVVGSIETINEELHKKVCPSKPIKPYELMFDNARELGLDTAMTFIVGLGETKQDFPQLVDFIKKHNISKIHIYALNPVQGTMYEHTPSPSKEYQAWWIAKTRIAFPHIDIQFGIWKDKVERISLLLQAGANSISKFPATRAFGKVGAKEVEKQAELGKRTFEGTLTKLPEIDWQETIHSLPFDDELKQQIQLKLEQYLKTMAKNSSP